MGQQPDERHQFGHDGPGVIVVGLDASEIGKEGSSETSQASLHAAAYAAGLARRQGARLVAVWVRPAVAYGDTFAQTADTIAKVRHETEEDVRQTVTWATKHYGIPEASLLVREGDPFRELTTVAEELQADAIIVGASEHRLGSLAVRLVRDARWPVTVVP